MMWPPIILTTVFIYYASAVTKDECLDFTVSDCYVDPSLIIWENDQVGTASLCQFACHNFPSCKEFRFYQDNCQLFSDNYKTSCDIIGGRADKSLEDCTGSVTVGGCDAFIEEECEYLGEDSGFSAPPGEFTSPVECEGYCKGFQVLGAEYWVWGKVNKTCDLLKSSKRTCLGISGPRDPPIEECQTPTTTTMPTTTPMPTTTTKPTTTPIPTTTPMSTTTPRPTTTSFPGCPSGWSRYENSCFKFVEVADYWSGAQYYCERKGGNLASIHSREENEFVKSLTSKWPSYHWIGGSDAISEGEWAWFDGSSWVYQNWLPGKPEGSVNKNCLAIDTLEYGNWDGNGKWRDLSCNQDKLFFVCRKY